ncbi:MAG: Holliday junction branch migration protein RuvA [Gammaproteobacteria bacterium]|nr:Holliday junction branch migration protein RuvA [Gammaproteobacteria bacterium]
MIGRIAGRFVEAVEQLALIDVGGVGYEVELSTGARSDLPPPGGDVALYTHLLVREDAQQLYGFASRSERELFRAVLRISGVGPKLALSLISAFDVDELAHAAADGDPGRLTRVPGIGRKTAQRMLLELKDRLAEFAVTPAVGRSGADASAAEAEHALIALGYRPQDAAQLVREVGDQDMATEAIVREALRAVARRSAS